MTLERGTKQDWMDENYTLMANIKGRWQKLKE